MFSKLAFFITALAVCAIASPTPGGEPTEGGQCNVGKLQCCNSVQSADSAAASKLLGLVGVAVQSVTVPVGLTCNPISVIGVGNGANCNAQPVCCENNNFNGVVALGCTPVNVNL